MEETLAFSSSSSNDSSSEEEKDHPPPKKLRQPVSKSKKQSRNVCTQGSSSSSSTRSFLKKWEQEFTWLEYDADCDGAFCRLCKMSKRSPGKTGRIWIAKPFSQTSQQVVSIKSSYLTYCN